MSNPDALTSHKIQFYVTTSYACGYIKDRISQSLVATPHHLISQTHYDDLIKKVFVEVVNLHTNLIVNYALHAFLFGSMSSTSAIQRTLKELLKNINFCRPQCSLFHLMKNIFNFI